MEFIKVGKNYMIKNSNGRIINEKEKLELETKQLQLENESCGCACPDKIKKISKNKKKIKEIEKKEQWAVVEEKDNKIHIRPVINGNIIETPIEKIENTALNEEVQDEIIKETDTTI